MKTLTTTLYLATAGLLLFVIGSAILLAPHAFHGSNGIVLGDNPNMLSEIRAPGGLLASSGLLVVISVFRTGLRAFAVQIAILVYGSFGMARLVSLYQDGMPSNSIVGAAVIELIIAVLGVAILWRQKSSATPGSSVASVLR